MIAELCHPDRSGRIFSFTPYLGVSGHEAEGSLLDCVTRHRFCTFAFNSRSALERHGFRRSPSWFYLELMTEN